MGQLRQLAGQTVIYGASSIVGRVLNYLLVPLYTSPNVLAPGEYGVVTELYAFVAFLNVLYTYGFETTYFRFATKSNSNRYFYLAESSLVITSLVFSALLIFLSDPIANLLQYPGRGHYITWLALILAIDAIVAIPFARLRLEGKAVRFATYKLINIGLNIFLNIFFLVFCPWWLSFNESAFITRIYNPEIGVGYVFLSNLIANSLYLIFFSNYFIKLRFRLTKELMPMLIYSIPLMIMGFAGVTNEMLSRVLLKYLLPENFYPGFTNQAILGIFGACYKLSVFMTLAVQAFRYAFEPFFFSKAQDKNSPGLFANVMHGFIIFGSFAWLLISLFLQDIAPIFLRTAVYLQALEIVPWLLGGGLFLGIYFNLSLWYKLSDKTIFGAWITVVGAIVTIVLNIALIPILGYVGSAITTFISYLSMTLISYYYGQKYYPVPYMVGRGLFYIALAGSSILAFYFWGFESGYRNFIAIGFLTGFVILVWLLDIRTGTFRQNT